MCTHVSGSFCGNLLIHLYLIMGRTRKKFNWKARISQMESEKADGQPEKTVELDFKVQEEKYDASNPLVLPSSGSQKKKKQAVKSVLQVKKIKPLSKKQKRKLAKILEKKQKKVDRVQLLEKLQTVQATSEELEKITSTSNMQTFGLKRQHSDIITANESGDMKVSSVRGSRKKKLMEKEPKQRKYDPNVVGLNSSSSGSDDNDDDQDENDQSKDSPVTCPGNVDQLQDVSSSESASKSTCPTSVSVDKKELNQKDSASESTSSENKTQTASSEPCEPAVYVHVERSPEIQALREALPIYSEEQAIMEAIREHPVVIIHGTTGSGKTTQVPQFLYEAGYTRNKKLIGITEPRRVAAVQMASRVAEEMNLPDAVSYHIRYEKTATEEKTEIKFMTDGVLLKEIRHDFLLTRYSVIIIDEAHERSVFSDVLIGLLSRILPLRQKKGNPLKLIIMSATLRVEDFTDNPRLFKDKPFLITLDSRQYDVVLHFNKKTPADYIKAAYDKVCRIHRELPGGAILVFVTGEKEVTRLCKILRKAFPFKKDKKSLNKSEDTKYGESEKKCQREKEEAKEGNEIQKTVSKKRKFSDNKKDESFVTLPPKIDLNDYSIEPLDNEGQQHQQSDDEEDEDHESLIKQFQSQGSFEPLYVLPLYSVLPTCEQAKVFQPPPAGSRLCVVATNVAETSITIPGLKYVVDTGKVKTRVYDKSSSGVSTFAITWTSKASANQRAGRAGRTEGGHCYRLYSSAVFENDFPEFTPPDIKSIPVDDILLQMKALGIDRVVNFPFPTPPDAEALKSAEDRLVKLGALEDVKKFKRFREMSKWEYSAKATPLGKAMARFPLSPRFAKMLLFSYKHEVIQLVIAAVSAMTVSEVFLMTAVQKEEDNDKDDEEIKIYEGIKKIGAGQGKSLKLGDVMVLLRAVATYELAENKLQFCAKYKVRHKAMVEIQKMRLQLIREMNRSFKDLHLATDLKLDPPNDDQIEKVRKIIASSMTDHIARKMTESELVQCELKVKNAYKCLDLEDPVFIHPSSVLFKELPDFVVYQEIFQTSKFYMRTVTEIEPEWLAAFAPSQCEFSAPLETPSPFYDKKADEIMCCMTSTFGPWNWQLPQVTMPMHQGLMKYTWFCFLFIDGQIFPALKQYRKSLISPASVMLKQWARLLPRTRNILQAVISKEVDSKASLYEAWKNNSKFLLLEYCDWLPEDKHMDVSMKWPPL